MRHAAATLSLICALMMAAGLLAASSARAADEAARPSIAVQFALDRPIDGSMAPFVLAANRGLFAAEGVAVTTEIAAGSGDVIGRVAHGTSEFGIADVNELIRYRDRPDAQPVKAVFMLFNRAPYALVARKSRGVQGLADIEGRTLGIADGDLSIRLWPAVARLNGIRTAQVKPYRMGAAVREPILAAGQVDAVTGFSFLSAINLRDRGIPADDLAVFRFADHGCEAYGFALIVNPAFAAKKPGSVKGFIRAVVGGINLAVKDPAAAAEDVAGRIEGGSRDLELERLRAVLADNILTVEVRRNGLGGIDPERFERAIDQVAEDYKFRKRPTAQDIFDDGFLPPVDSRMIN